MSFFEPPDPPLDPPEWGEIDEPEWSGPPRHVLGAAVPLRSLLARTDELAIAITDATAYMNGFEFKLVLRSRRPSHDYYGGPFGLGEPMMWRHGRGVVEGGDLPPELFRFGIEFADGSKATTLGGHPFEEGPDHEPEGPLLIERGGGGGGGDWDQSYWVWPLPPPGRLAFVCEWPSKGVSITRLEMDAKVILDAADQAEILWDDPGGRRLSADGGTILRSDRSSTRGHRLEETEERGSEQPPS